MNSSLLRNIKDDVSVGVGGRGDWTGAGRNLISLMDF